MSGLVEELLALYVWFAPSINLEQAMIVILVTAGFVSSRV